MSTQVYIDSWRGLYREMASIEIVLRFSNNFTGRLHTVISTTGQVKKLEREQRGRFTSAKSLFSIATFTTCHTLCPCSFQSIYIFQSPLLPSHKSTVHISSSLSSHGNSPWIIQCRWIEAIWPIFVAILLCILNIIFHHFIRFSHTSYSVTGSGILFVFILGNGPG